MQDPGDTAACAPASLPPTAYDRDVADDPQVLSVATTTHGRVLIRRPASPHGILAGFHGYLENAEIQLARLDSIPGAEHWLRISLQGLHRVYRGRSQDVVASWMTREDRETAIADNIAYATAAVALVAQDVPGPVVYVGFSQGGQMAFRAAVRGAGPAAGVISIGADVPPELLADPAARFPPVMLARGADDAWYTAAIQDADATALRERGVAVEAIVYAGGHEWTGGTAAAAGRWLEAIAART
jgi:predicted esterase